MSFGGGDFDKSCVERLGRIVALAGGVDAVTIVVSSTWRLDPGKMQRLNEAFSACVCGEGEGGKRTIPAVSLGVPNGVPNPTLAVTYLRKDPSEQKLVKERVDEIAFFLEQHRQSYPLTGICVVDPPVEDEPPAADSVAPPAETAATPAPEGAGGKKGSKKVGAGKKDYGGPPPPVKMLPMKSYPGRWFAIDDMDLGVDPRMQPGHFLKTEIEEGIQDKDVAAACQLIGALPPPVVVVVAAAAAPLDAVDGATGRVANPDAGTGKRRRTKKKNPNDAQAEVSCCASRQREPKPPSQLPVGVALQGVVKRYNPNRGFGFLRCGTEDIFVHQLHIQHEGFRGLNVAQPVSFEVEADEDGSGKVHAVKVHQLTPYCPTFRLDPETGLHREIGGHSDHPDAGARGVVPIVVPVAAVQRCGLRNAGQQRQQHAAPADQPSSNNTHDNETNPGKEKSRRKVPSTNNSNNSASNLENDDAQRNNSSSAKLSRRKRKAARDAALAAAYGIPAAADQEDGAAAVAPAAAGPAPADDGAVPFFYPPPRPEVLLVLPLIPDGLGYRSANGTVFYPLMPPPYSEDVLDAPPTTIAPHHSDELQDKMKGKKT